MKKMGTIWNKKQENKIKQKARKLLEIVIINQLSGINPAQNA